jgi:AraC-like DNA-binding protein
MPALQTALFSTTKTFAPHPVWAGSVREARFAPLSKRDAVRAYHDARRFERQTRTAGRQDGRIGRNGLAVLHALIFDCLNFRTGRLDPSYETLARLACLSVRSVARGLAKLRSAGVLSWLNRVRLVQGPEGGAILEQDTNAYGICPTGHWKGYRAPVDPPKPEHGTAGEHPPLAAGIDAAAEAIRDGAAYGRTVPPETIISALESDSDPLSRAMAALARTRS